MLNVWKIIWVVVIVLFLSTISFAATCALGDKNCDLNKMKLQLMDKMSVKPITTKDQTTTEVEKPKNIPFQIPRPVSSQVQPISQPQDTKEESDQLQPEQPKINPGLKIFTQPNQNSKATVNNLKQQESEVKTQPQSGIIYR